MKKIFSFEKAKRIKYSYSTIRKCKLLVKKHYWGKDTLQQKNIQMIKLYGFLIILLQNV